MAEPFYIHDLVFEKVKNNKPYCREKVAVYLSLESGRTNRRGEAGLQRAGR